tara:strand:- start:207 stop:581 length:375 start_codon:yes stop_codon:yes gene_type:complete
MALSISSVVADAGSLHCVQTAASNTPDVLKGSAGNIFKVEIVNENAYAVYLKFWDTTGAVTPGGGGAANEPDWVLMCPASSTRAYSCPSGSAFGTGLKVACLTTPGTVGNVSPASTVSYRILIG